MKKFLSGFITCLVLLAVTLTVTASDGSQQISVWYGVNLNINGNYFIPTDVNGNAVPAFIYNGTTYVPIRAISELYGADVEWDNATKTAYINYEDYEAMLAYVLGQQSKPEVYVPDVTVSPTTVSFPLHLYSNDWKTYLGKCVTDELDSDGIYYKLIGDYSWKFSATSIWNTIGDYGSSYSDTSAFCSYASHPPKIIDNDGRFIAYLTINETISPRWTIAKLRLFLEENGQ